MILEIDNVELNFSARKILNGVYLKGETDVVIGILGSNGSGKSCLLQILFGSLQPKYKLIRVDQKPILKPLFKTGKVKFLPQFSFIPNTIHIIKVFNLYKVDWEPFIDDFSAFERHKHSKMKNLSGGEKRVIEIYITLKSQSQIVLLDEPFSHLSPIYIEKITDLIKREKSKKIIIITDHMYRHILDVSDEIYLLTKGNTKLMRDVKELENYNYLSVGSLS